MDPVTMTLGIGSILGNVFGNLFGANKQADSAERAARVQSQTALDLARMEREALDEQLGYLRQQDSRDYSDWLAREARDRRDWEASEQRRAPFRALADSAIRTLADYIKVPGMRSAQEVPVQQWTHQAAPMTGPTQQPPAPMNTAMPVGVREPMPLANASGFVGPQRPQRRTLADYAR